MKYSLSEFRANTREAFNMAEGGGEVLIDRHGIIFELRRLPYLIGEDISKRPVVLRDDLNKGSTANPVFGTSLANPPFNNAINRPEPKVDNTEDWGA